MDAAQLARWTRFAAKGGIGKCTGVNDCIAQNSEDLMFIQGDEIVVLMRIPDTEDVYLGFCEGVIGRFHGQDVRFHGKLKKPIMTKRSSVSAAKTPSPSVGHSTPSPSRTNSLSAKDADENQSFPPTRSPLASKKTVHVPSLPSTDDEALSPPSMSVSASTMPSEQLVTTPPRALDRDRAPRRSLGSDSGRSGDLHLSSPPFHSPPQIIFTTNDIPPPLVSAPVVSPLNIVKKSPTSSPLQTVFNVVAQEDLVETSTTTNSGDHDDDAVMSDARLQVPGDGNDSDGEVGIGLSLLQSLGGDSDEESFVQRKSVQYDEESAVEGLLYDDPEEAEASPNTAQVEPPTPQTATTNVPHSPPHAQDDSSHLHSQTVTLPSRSSSPRSSASPKSSASLSPPPNHQHFSLSSRRPSVQSQSSWEGAGDIYDDYRYSRASMLSGSTIGTMSRGRSSVGSRVSVRDWDSHVHDQPPPPPPPPIPDSRPSIDLVFASSEVSASVSASAAVSASASVSRRDSASASASRPGSGSGSGANTPGRCSIDSRKSNEALRKSLTASSTTSQKSTESSSGPSERGERESTRRSRQELLFPQPPTGVNLQHDMVLDQATRESLRRSSEASRILRPADFRLSVDSEVSIYSRISEVAEVEGSSPIDEHHDDTTVPAHPLSDSPVQEETDESSSKHLRPAPLELASQQRQSRSPLLHTAWATPISSPSDSTFASTSSATPTTSLFMPTALTSFTSGMASALRQKVVISRSPGSSDGVSSRGEEVGKKEREGVEGEVEGGEGDETLKDIVVEDEEDIPSGVVQEMTFETEYTHDAADTTFDTSKGTIILPESVQAVALGQTQHTRTRTPSNASNASELEMPPDVFDTSNDGPPSPMVPSGPPFASPLSPTSPTTSPTSPTSPSSPTTTTTSTSSPTHLRSTQLVTTLADLREGGGAMIPGTNQRRSLFLPHPNAPKPPQMGTMGPMFIRRSMYQQSSTTDSLLSPLSNSFVATTQEDMTPVTSVLSPSPLPSLQKRSLFEVMHMAMNGVTSAAMRPRLLANGGLTIYGCLEVELSESVGPVPISFSVEPPPPRQVIPPQQQQYGGPLPPPQFVVQPPPMTATLPGVIERSGPGGSGSLGPGGGGGGSVPPSPRSATSSPAFGGSVAGGVSDGEGSNASSISGGVIPRANFFPKKPGVRPRSRSFSSFHSHTTQIEVLLPVSREDGAPALIGTPSVNDVRASLQSLRTNSRSSVRSSLSQGHISGPSPSNSRLSPLRLSPLNTTGSSPLRPGPNNNAKPPSSPLAHSFLPNQPPPSSPARANASLPGPSGLQPPPALRQITSRSTLNDAVLSRPSLTVTNPDMSPSSSDALPNPLNGRKPRRSHEADDAQLRSQANLPSMSTSPPIHSASHRQPSLRTKLSLPNLRRNRSKNDEVSTTTSVPPTSPVKDHSYNVSASTVQVQDLDFELVRPTLQFQQSRASEDSGVLGRGSASVDIQPPEGVFHPQRAASPASPLNGPRSPTGDGPSSSWPPRPSLSQAMTTTPAPIPLPPRTTETESDMIAHRHRESKWMSLISSIPPSQSRKSKKVKRLIHEGVPSSVRYLVWSHLTDGKAKVVPGVYFQLGMRERIRVAEKIEEDILRCFQEQVHLQGKRGPVLALLQAYLTMVPDVRYTTGLTLIAGQLLLHAPEEDAFWIFVSIMDTHIRPYFSTSTTQLEVDATLFSRTLESNDALLGKKLFMDMGIEPIAICGPWFTTLFVSTLPPDYVNRVWDLFLFEGIPFLLRVGCAIMSCCRSQLLNATSPDTILTYLLLPPPSCLPSTPEAFLSLANGVKMKDDDVRKSRVKMEALVKKQVQAQGGRHLPIMSSISLPRS